MIWESETSVQTRSFSLLELSVGPLSEQPSCPQHYNEYLVCSGEMGVDFGAAATQTGIQRVAELFLAP